MFNFKNSNSGKIRVKLLATLLVLTLTFANFALVGSYIGESIAAEIDLNKQDNSTNNENVKSELYFDEENSIKLTQELITNKIYSIQGTEKRIIQYKITSGITDNQYSIKSTLVTLKVPAIEETMPEEVVVSAYSLNGTNPNERLNFKKYDEENPNNAYYKYNESEGIVSIEVKNNENDSNEITWNKEGLDEFVVTYIYPADVEIQTLESEVSNEIVLFGLDDGESYGKTIELDKMEELSNIVSIETSAEDIYKGKMYIGEDTNYETISKIHVSYSKIADGIIYTETSDEFPEGINSYYKTTKINKADAKNVLGEKGTITIIATPDIITEESMPTTKIIDLSVEEEGDYYIVNHENDISQITIGLGNIESEGIIEIINERTIKTEDTTRVQELKEVKVNERLQLVNSIENEEETITEVVETIINTYLLNLKEPSFEAEFGITRDNGTTNFSTSQENDVNFTIILKTDNEEYKLYDSPEIIITLPDVVESIKDVNASMMNSSSTLTVESADPENNTIKVKLSGKQESYPNLNEQISINAKIKAKELIPTVDKNIEMKIIEGAETVVEKSQTVTFEAEQGVLLATSVSNFNSENSTITSFGKKIATGKLTENAEARTATVKGTIINNTELDLENIVVFARIQNERVKELTIEKIEKRSVFEFEYDVLIPENLETNKEIIVDYEVVYGDQPYTAPVVKLQTPKEVKLDLELTANVQDGQEVYEGQCIEYNVKVKNTGEVDAEKFKLNMQVEGLTIVEGQTAIEGLNIKVGETFETEKSIKAIVNKDIATTSFTAEVTKDIEATVYLKETKGTITNTVSKVGVELEIINKISTYSKYVEFAQIGFSINYKLKVTNTSDKDLTEVQILDKLPEELKFEELYVFKKAQGETTKLDLEQIENSYNEQTKELKVKIDKLQPGEEILISIYTNVENVVDKVIINSAYVAAKEYSDIKFGITDIINVIGLPNIKYSITSNKEGNLNAGDIIEYTINVINTGETAERISIESIIPEQLDIQNAYYYRDGQQGEAGINPNKVSLDLMWLEQNQELIVKITAKANEIVSNTNIENIVTIEGIYIEGIEEKLENVVIGTGKDSSDDPSDDPNDDPSDNPSNNPSGDQNSSDNPENQESTYSISGVAWQDDNKNGLRENEEKLLEGIVVKIKDAKTNEYVKDEQENSLQQTTNQNGIYEFTNLKPGKYIVVFEYNKTTYSPTAYQKAEVDSKVNSDARLVTEENNNITKTDIIEIKNSNVSNIDIGLILNPVFDLKLDKYITKVSVQNSNGTKVYEYDNTQLAKVEIPAKVLDGSLVIVEYQIDVTNEGDIPAHVDSIVDYVSPQFEFKSELNTTWYKASDNNLYCIEFANEDLQPGKTVSTKLVLTKTMTNNNTGLINNAAEIYETFNEYAYEDIDSTVANKEQEDDLSEADLIISPKTGGPLLYIGIVIISMFVLSAGIYLINKKVIKNHII